MERPLRLLPLYGLLSLLPLLAHAQAPVDCEALSDNVSLKLPSTDRQWKPR